MDENGVILSQNTGFISTGDTIKKLEARKIELTSTLDLETHQVFDDATKRDELQNLVNEIQASLDAWSRLTTVKPWTQPQTQSAAQIVALQKSLTEKILLLSHLLDVGPFSENTSYAELQHELPTLQKLAQKKIADYTTSLQSEQKTQNDLIDQQKKELDAVNREVTGLNEVRNVQISDTFQKIGWYLVILISLYCVRFVTRRLLLWSTRDFSKSHQQALHLAHHWFFNILFVVAFWVIFITEFLSFLSFFAIIGTAIGLALRDVIYSFIGWFAIGSDSGYQDGDFIEFDETQGRVYQITPLLTNIEEYGVQGFTGKIISFPNKNIFEKNVKNWSRGSDLSLMSVEFLLTHESNVEHAKEILTHILEKDQASERVHANEINAFKNMFHYGDDDIIPKIHITIEPRGIMLRARILVHVEDKISEQNSLTESFIEALKETSDITFRTVH